MNDRGFFLTPNTLGFHGMAPSKILAIKIRSLGDTVLFTAPLLELARAYPQAEIHAVVTEPWAPLLEALPGVHRVWTVPSHASKLSRTWQMAYLASQLRNQRFDTVVNFHASSTSAFLALTTGAKARAIHFHGHHDQNRFSTVTIPGKGTLKPIIERDMDALRALSIHVPAGRMPRISLQLSELDEAALFLHKLNLEGPILSLGLGASRPTKSWPIERFAALAIEWCQKENGGVLALAGHHEEQLVHAFLKSVNELLNAMIQDPKTRAHVRSQITASHRLSVRMLAGVLAKTSVFAGNDSGPKHLAVAVETPSVTLFGPEHPFEWHPYPQQRHPYFFIESLSCRTNAAPGMPAWCGIQECIIESHKCMRQIGVHPVLTECQRIARRLN